MRPLIVLPVALLLAACEPTPQQIALHRTPICDALIGPIRYSSTNKQSNRYAAAVLALDLKQRNQVGEYLRCPAYR